jgi:hypothetical protein
MNLINMDLSTMDKTEYKDVWDRIYGYWKRVITNKYMTTLLESDKIIHLKRPVKNNRMYDTHEYGWIRLEDYNEEDFRNCGKYIDSKGLQHTAYLFWQAIYDTDSFTEVKDEPDLTKKEDIAKVKEELAAIFIGAVVHNIHDGRRHTEERWRGQGYKLLSMIQIILSHVHDIKWHHAVTSTLPIDAQMDIFKCPDDYHELLEIIIHISIINMACYRPVVIHNCTDEDKG